MKRRAQPWLGTLVDITVNDLAGNADDDARLDRGINEAFAAIANIHRLMSFHDAQSDVARINRAAVGEVIMVEADTALVLITALMLQAASNGIFNISSAERLVSWGLLPKMQTDGAVFEKTAGGLGYGLDCGLNIDDAHSVHKTHTVIIDVGGIAKGYAVDCAIDVLQRAGIQSACVNAGGDLRVLGDMPFSIAIRDPITVTGIAQQITIANSALATSAPYFSRSVHGGKAVSALVDGRTGMPVTQSISASVTAPTCMIADALTKIVIASGDTHHFLLERFGAQAFMIGQPHC